MVHPEAANELEIRVVGEGDISRLVALDGECFDPPWGEEHYQRERVKERSLLLAAASGGELWGFLSAWVVYDELQIMRIATAPAGRRRGVGRALMERAFAHAAERGLAKVTLEVKAVNQAAIALYEHLGMEREGCRPKYYNDGSDALLFGKGC